MLDSKQKVFLRSLAQKEKPLFQVGKDGISDNLIKTVSEAFNNRELLKVSILKSAGDDVKTIGFDLAMLTKSELIQVIGRQVVLYKRNKEPRILLP